MGEKLDHSKVWQESHGAICSLIFSSNGTRISSGTGFIVGTKLITNNHVIQVPATRVEISFVATDGHSLVFSKSLGIAEFRNRLVDGDPESSWDYAILDVSDFQGLRPLVLAKDDELSIGTSLVWLGFQFDQQNLSLHSGILSSKFTQADVNYLQLDGSVNQGNSGGPLINPASMEVVGVITRKATGLTEEFDKLIDIFGKNAVTLQSAPVVMNVGGFDPLKIHAQTQLQMQQVSKEIWRSANVGIGYAYELRKIRSSLENAV